MVGRSGLSLGSPSRNDVGGERRPAKPERKNTEACLYLVRLWGAQAVCTPGTLAGTSPELVPSCLARACQPHCTPAAPAPGVPSSPPPLQYSEARGWLKEKAHLSCGVVAKGVLGMGGPEVISIADNRFFWVSLLFCSHHFLSSCWPPPHTQTPFQSSGLDTSRTTRHHGLVDRVYRERGRLGSPHRRPLSVDKHGRQISFSRGLGWESGALLVTAGPQVYLVDGTASSGWIRSDPAHFPEEAVRQAEEPQASWGLWGTGSKDAELSTGVCSLR